MIIECGRKKINNCSDDTSRNHIVTVSQLTENIVAAIQIHLFKSSKCFIKNR